jgi:TatD DNase family protein
LTLDLIDIGANLTHESFAPDLDAVMARALQAGVRRQIVTGADLPGSLQAAMLADRHPANLRSTAGVHPHHAESFVASHAAELLDLLKRPAVVAAGECGLDYFRNIASPQAQRRAFSAQLEIAAAAGKPVFLHQRDAHADFTAILQEHIGGLHGGVAHCFTGGGVELEAYLALGLYIGITGWVSDDRRGASVREVAARIPDDRLLVETDAPYLLPRDLRPKPKSRRNEPALLVHVAQTVADLRGATLEAIAALTNRNAESLFGWRDAP